MAHQAPISIGNQSQLTEEQVDARRAVAALQDLK